MGSSAWGNKELYVPEKNQPVFINVDSRIVKKHSLWKENYNHTLKDVPFETLQAILYSLGFNIKEGWNEYTGVIRNKGNKLQGFESRVFCGQLRDNFTHKEFYNDVEVLTLPVSAEEDIELIKLEEYGSEYFTDVNGKGSPMSRGVGRRHGPYRKSAKMIEKQKRKDKELMDQWEKDNEDRRKNGGSRVR